MIADADQRNDQFLGEVIQEAMRQLPDVPS